MKYLIAALLVAAPVSVEAAEIQHGKWVSSGKVTAADMPGMPPNMVAMMQNRKIGTSYCMTEKEASDPRKMLRGDTKGCEYTKFEMGGGKIHAVMQCQDQGGKSRMTMYGTYTRTSYATTNIMNMQGPGGKMSMTTKMTGRRTGPC